MAAEPTNERLQTYLAQGFGHWTQQVHDLCRALLAARETIATKDEVLRARQEYIDQRHTELAERDSQIAALREQYDAVTVTLRQERDSLRGELEERKAQLQASRDQVAHLTSIANGIVDIEKERDSLRGELEAAKKRELEWDETLKVTARTLDAVVQERDAARAGMIRMREALKDMESRFIGLFNACLRAGYHPSSNPDDDLNLALADCRAAISSTADSAESLEKRLAEAENKGYERGRANVEEWRQIEARAEQRGYERGKAEAHAMRRELVTALERAIRALNFADTPEARVVHFAEFVTQLNPVLARARAMDQEKP